MGIGITKSMEKVSRKDATHASLKARLSFLGSSSASSSSCVSFCSSVRMVVGGWWPFSFSLAALSMEPELAVAGRDGALIRRVMSQLKGSGLYSETATVTMSPVRSAARLPAKVGYSIPVVDTLKLP